MFKDAANPGAAAGTAKARLDSLLSAALDDPGAAVALTMEQHRSDHAAAVSGS
jgi:hypothetical protein